MPILSGIRAPSAFVYLCAMKHDFYLFPAGLSGLALLLLRVSIGLFLIAAPAGRIAYASWPALMLDALALAVVAGFRTRIAALLSCSVAFGMAVTEGGFQSHFSSFVHPINAVILAMTGPGAYSLDARLFGRRTVRLQANR